MSFAGRIRATGIAFPIAIVGAVAIMSLATTAAQSWRDPAGFGWDAPVAGSPQASALPHPDGFGWD
jgi:hypothetical protein